jgi:hypothetical protein
MITSSSSYLGGKNRRANKGFIRVERFLTSLKNLLAFKQDVQSETGHKEVTK